MTWERLGDALAVGDLMVIPVERISLGCQRWGGALFVAGSKQPVAVLLRRGDREWRLAIPDGAQPAAFPAER